MANVGSGDGGSTSDSPSVSTKKAAAYVSGTSILWVSLVELGIAKVLEAGALGFANVIFTLSRIQVDLVVGFGDFLAALVTTSTEGPTAAIAAAWDASAFATFGAAAPLVVIAEIVVIFAVATWAVRRL